MSDDPQAHFNTSHSVTANSKLDIMVITAASSDGGSHDMHDIRDTTNIHPNRASWAVSAATAFAASTLLPTLLLPLIVVLP